MKHGTPTGASGFTLIELAIVVFVIGLLVAGLIGPVEVQLEARDRQRTRQMLEAATEALYGYALTEGRLPCGDVDGDGLSDPPFDPGDADSAECDADARFLPWAELGLEPADAWGNRLRYAVRAPEFTWPDDDGTCDGGDFDLCAEGNFDVTTRGDDAATSGIEGKHPYPAATASGVAAVLLSHGRNGFGATAADGSARPGVPAGNDDEAENADDDLDFVSRGYSRDQAGCADDDDESAPLCEFDDMLVTLSRAILNNRMVAAGQLP